MSTGCEWDLDLSITFKESLVLSLAYLKAHWCKRIGINNIPQLPKVEGLTFLLPESVENSSWRWPWVHLYYIWLSVGLKSSLL